MLNRIILIGRLTRDPELRYTGNGNAVVRFSLAVDRPFKNQEGKNDADFIRIVAWRKLAEAVANNISKGRLVAVDGRLQIDNYTDKEGNKRQSAEVVAENIRFLDWPKDNQGNRNNVSTPSLGGEDDFPFGNDFNYSDDIPF